MDLSKVQTPQSFPSEVNAIIEIPANSPGIKYEFDKESGMMFVDRFLSTAMHYPLHYGFIPHTKAGDGDPVDILIFSDYPLAPGCVIPCRPVGLLRTKDEKGTDEKLLGVPTSSITKEYDHIQEITDITEYAKSKISHFFERYKDLEKGKFVEVMGFEGKSEAHKVLKQSLL